MRKYEMFWEPIVVSGSILYNILNCIVEWFSIICGCKHGWLNHIKTSCTIYVIVLSLYCWSNVVGIKTFTGTIFWVLKQTFFFFWALRKHFSNLSREASWLPFLGHLWKGHIAMVEHFLVVVKGEREQVFRALLGH